MNKAHGSAQMPVGVPVVIPAEDLTGDLEADTAGVQALNAGVAASGECLEHGAYREHDEAVKLVPELRSHLAGELKDDAVQRVVSDRLGIAQSRGGAPSLQDDVGGGEDLQQDAGTIQVHGRQCTGAPAGRTLGVLVLQNGQEKA